MGTKTLSRGSAVGRNTAPCGRAELGQSKGRTGRLDRALEGQSFEARHPALRASDSEQNQRSPLEMLIWVWS